ncbi:MAG: srpR 1 [Ilumatobacteraceae bacterium]|nr:srpR 1 [Ilumatobacteraceae bacterium]
MGELVVMRLVSFEPSTIRGVRPVSTIHGASAPFDASARPMRADAVRNRERVLGAAREAFAELGPDAPLDEIARRAGVGAGTVHRHFPSKESLFAAVLATSQAEITERALALSSGHADGEAFFLFFADVVERGVVDRGLAEALVGAGVDVSPSTDAAGERFMSTLEALVSAAQRAGAVRSDVVTRDVKAVFVGVVAAAVGMGLDGAERARLIDIAAAGLRPR